jgi:hypothetical protein
MVVNKIPQLFRKATLSIPVLIVFCDEGWRSEEIKSDAELAYELDRKDQGRDRYFRFGL